MYGSHAAAEHTNLKSQKAVTGVDRFLNTEHLVNRLNPEYNFLLKQTAMNYKLRLVSSTPFDVFVCVRLN